MNDTEILDWTPFLDTVFVFKIEPDDSQALIIKPEIARREGPVAFGRIAEIGKGKKTATGEYQSPEFEPGDLVLYDARAGYEMNTGNPTLGLVQVLRVENIVAVFDECEDCKKLAPHVHCRECGATDHLPANCDMEG